MTLDGKEPQPQDLTGEDAIDDVKLKRNYAKDCLQMTLRSPEMSTPDEKKVREYIEWQIEVCDLVIKKNFDQAKVKFNEPTGGDAQITKALDTITHNVRRIVNETNTAIRTALIHFTGSYTLNKSTE